MDDYDKMRSAAQAEILYNELSGDRTVKEWIYVIVRVIAFLLSEHIKQMKGS